MKIRIKMFLVAALLSLCAAMCANAQNLNGTLDPSFYGPPLYVQTINTGFGGSSGFGDATGSELDAVYARVSGGNLYLFIAGCLQANGNVLNVFVAGGAPGETTLQVPTGYDLGNMNGSGFPPGFQATWAFDMNDYYGTLYSEEYNLMGTPSGGYVGSLSESSSGIAAGSDGGVASIYFNNTLVSTMGTPGTALSGSDSGANTMTGFELVVPLSSIGYTSGSVNVLVCISGSGDTYLSNQFLPGLSVGTQNLGTEAFNSGPPTYVTFQLDMSHEVANGNFVNTDENPSDPNYGQPYNSVAVGGINGDWGRDHQLTNYTLLNPTDNNPGLKTNLYLGTFQVQGVLPTTIDWKFLVNDLEWGYEVPVSTAGQNRTTTITQLSTVLPVITYDDLGPLDFTHSNMVVTFSVLVTNGTPDDTGYEFEKGSDQVFFNGAWLEWPSWGIDNLPQDQQMIEVGTSDVYTNSFFVPKGTSIYMNYKYSFDGFDDENGLNTNHVREIRTYGPTYRFPQDVWSWTVMQPGNGNPSRLAGLAVTNLVEPDFGYLQIGKPSGGGANLPITWLGRQDVLLQNASNLAGPWNTLIGTDNAQSANWPNIEDYQFFRLVKESPPVNLLADPGFETQSGWTLFSGAQYSQNYAHSGSWSMLDAASGGVPGCYQQFPASPGMKFEMTGYGFTPSPLTGGTAYGILQITYFDSNGNNLGTVQTSPGNALASQEINSNTPAGVWTFLDTGVATAPPNTACLQAFTLYVGFSGTEEGVYFDDLSLVQVQ